VGGQCPNPDKQELKIEDCPPPAEKFVNVARAAPALARREVFPITVVNKTKLTLMGCRYPRCSVFLLPVVYIMI